MRQADNHRRRRRRALVGMSANHLGDAITLDPKPLRHSIQAKRTVMKKFTRQTSGNAPTADVNLDFGAAGAKVARLFEPGEYRLRIELRPHYSKQSERFCGSGPHRNGKRQPGRHPTPCGWTGRTPARAILLGEPGPDCTTANPPSSCQPRVTLATSFRNWRGWSSMRASYSTADSRSGRTYNALADIYVDDVP